VENKSEIVIYTAKDGTTKLDVTLQDETLWLTQNQIVDLFDSSKANISEHISNIYKSGELNKDSTVRKIRTVQQEGGRSITRNLEHYNLDMIISIGYRVNSKRGTQFRIWANNVLKEYIIKGYALNVKNLQEKEEAFKDLRKSINLIEKTIEHKVKDLKQAKIMIKILSDFSKGLSIIDDYDNNKLDKEGKTKREAVKIGYDEYKSIIKDLTKKFDSSIFGKEKDDSFYSSINQIYQTFNEKDLYSGIENKAAMLLYFIVKNHSFVDGNKRIAAALFLYFLERNGLLYDISQETIISEDALATLTLMIAESNTKDKDIIIKIVTSILNRS